MPHLRLPLAQIDAIVGEIPAATDLVAELTGRGPEGHPHLVDRAKYQRRRYPPRTKISFEAFCRDRRRLISNRWREVR